MGQIFHNKLSHRNEFLTRKLFDIHVADEILIKKIKDKINKNENILQNKIDSVQKIWEDTGLDPKDPSYLVEKTMRFEMAKKEIDKVFSLFKETVDNYKRLCEAMEKSDES
jgi:hypothetical protein